MDLKHLIADEATIAIKFGDDTLNVIYRPGAVSFAETKVFASATTPEEVADFFLRWIVDWDLVSDGEPVPLSWESVMDLPIGAVTKILVAMQRVGSVGEASGAT